MYELVNIYRGHRGGCESETRKRLKGEGHIRYVEK